MAHELKPRISVSYVHRRFPAHFKRQWHCRVLPTPPTSPLAIGIGITPLAAYRDWQRVKRVIAARP